MENQAGKRKTPVLDTADEAGKATRTKMAKITYIEHNGT